MSKEGLPEQNMDQKSLNEKTLEDLDRQLDHHMGEDSLMSTGTRLVELARKCGVNESDITDLNDRIDHHGGEDSLLSTCGRLVELIRHELNTSK